MGGREGFSAGWSGRGENKQPEPPWISNTCKGEYMGESVIENILTKRYLTLEIENTFRSYIDSITLWAWIWSSSQARVTLKSSFASRRSLKATLMFDSKSFHRTQSFSLAIWKWLFPMWSGLNLLLFFQFKARLWNIFSCSNSFLPRGCFFTNPKCQPLKEISELFLPKKD